MEKNVKGPDIPRALYTADQLKRLLEPRSVAIVGASATPGSIGHQVLKGQAGFSGTVYAINPKHAEILGHRTYPDLKSLPEAPDCVVLATARASIEPLVEQCAEIGAGGIVIFASGFAEMDDPHFMALQDRISRAAAHHAIPVLGPNCIGFANIARNAFLTFVTVTPLPVVNDRAIGVVSQSGALGFALGQAATRGVSFSHLLATGNACDVDAADCVAYLAATPECRAIICLIEGLRCPERMVEAARLARLAGKPLILCAAGNSAQGAIAARAHTGSQAGSLDGVRDQLAREGAVFTNDYNRLVELAAFFIKAPLRPAQDGAGILATSGGAAIFAADAAEANGVDLPQPSPALLEKLGGLIPDFVTIRNPCDVTAQSGPEAFNECVRLMAASGGYGALIVPQTASWRGAEERIARLAHVAEEFDLPICAVWLSEDIGGASTHVIEQSKLVLFRSMDRCFSTLALWRERSRVLEAAQEVLA